MARDKIPPGQLKKLLDFNKERAEAKSKNAAGETLAKAIEGMPPGQRKQFLTNEVRAALLVFGIDI